MGVDVELKVQNLSLLYWKSYFDKNALGMFFTDNDLVITENVKYDAEDSDEEPHIEGTSYNVDGAFAFRLQGLVHSVSFP